MPITNNFDQFSKAMEELANDFEQIGFLSFDYVGKTAVEEMRKRAPLGETGDLKRGIKKVNSSRRTVEIVSEAPYSAAVDKGHKTRQGTGKAPNYKPKPGGITHVPADPFFTSVVEKLTGDNGELIKRAKVEADNMISIKLSKYRLK